MYTRFEEFAAGSMLGTVASPPRVQGKLAFEHDWERNLFGIALALSKSGVFDWEEFRAVLIEKIARWENAPCENQPPWEYYECFYQALETLLAARGLTANLGPLEGSSARSP